MPFVSSSFGIRRFVLAYPVYEFFTYSQEILIADSGYCGTGEFSSIDLGEPIGKDSRWLWTSNATAFRSKALRVSQSSNKRLRPCYKHTGLKLPQSLSRGLPGSSGAVLSIFLGHDANMAIGIDGQVQCVFELERFFGARYFYPKYKHYIDSHDDHTYASVIRSALQALLNGCECEGAPCPKTFEYGVLVDVVFWKSPMEHQVPILVKEYFTVKNWRHCHHHEAHALLSYYSSPFKSALVLTLDQGGDDGIFNLFLGHGQDMWRIGRWNYNFCHAYLSLVPLLPEVAPSGSRIHDELCSMILRNPILEEKEWVQVRVRYSPLEQLALAGKLMGYSGAFGKTPSSKVTALVSTALDQILGKTRPLSEPAARKKEREFQDFVPAELLRHSCTGQEAQLEIAAAIQAHWQQRLASFVAEVLRLLSPHHQVEGICLGGGGALNVIANQRIRDTLTSSGLHEYVDAFTHEERSQMPIGVHVPPAPNDSGLSVGGLWFISPPQTRQNLNYLGLRCWDHRSLSSLASEREAKNLTDLGGVSYLAELLTGGPAWMAQDGSSSTRKPIIGVVRGRQEFGPRALGHRSLLAVPDSMEMKTRLNKLKFRQWYRPVAPMIAVEDLDFVFGRYVASPSMEFAPQVRDHVQSLFPALAHTDGTARHQSVSKVDEPWLHSLLSAVGKKTGVAALINTSFNSKGKPITNSIAESLQMLDDLLDLDFVLIEDWLFRKSPERRSASPLDSRRNASYSGPDGYALWFQRCLDNVCVPPARRPARRAEKVERGIEDRY